jgi:hypothetical protein
MTDRDKARLRHERSVREMSLQNDLERDLRVGRRQSMGGSTYRIKPLIEDDGQ